MKDMPVNKLMIQMGIPMILSMALQAVYNIVEQVLHERWQVYAFNMELITNRRP